jgi:hypothetical protein
LKYNKIPSASIDGISLVCAFRQAKLYLPEEMSPRLKEAFQHWQDILTMELLTKAEWNLDILLIANANDLPKSGNQALFIDYRITLCH